MHFPPVQNVPSGDAFRTLEGQIPIPFVVTDPNGIVTQEQLATILREFIHSRHGPSLPPHRQEAKPG